MKRISYTAALTVLALAILAPAALAQPGGALTCEDFPDQGAAQEAFDIAVSTGDPGVDLEALDEDGDGAPCEELPPDPSPNRPATGAAPGPSAATCGDFTDQGEAQEFFNRVVRGDPALLDVDPNALDGDADGIACEELPTVTDPNDPTYTCDNFFDQARAQAHFDANVVGNPEADPSLLDEDGDGIACEDLPEVFDPDRTYACEDFEDQGQAQRFFDDVVVSLPGADLGVLDEDGDGIACEELPTDTGGEDEEPPEDLEDQPTLTPPPGEEVSDGETTTTRERRERRERTEREKTGGGDAGGEESAGEVTGGGGTGETTDVDGGSGGSGEGESGGGSGSGGSGGGSGGGESGGGSDAQGGGGGDAASRGGVSGAVADAASPVTRGRLPNTGGGWAVLLVAGAALIGGGLLLVRRFSSSA